jgi:hypothetical protein
MSRLLIALIAASNIGPAFAADSYPWMQNEAGGRINLKRTKCSMIQANRDTRDMLEVFYTTPRGESGDGCWKVEGDNVLVYWEHGTKARYPISHFNYNKGN